MTFSTFSERKSADVLAFEHYLRSGEMLTTGEWLQLQEWKFNPYHDRLGRFTFASGAVAMASRPGDWDDRKATRIGLRKGQKMTPAISAFAALEWLRYKSEIHDGRGRVIGHRSEQASLERYNGNGRITRQSGSVPHHVWYARTILQMAREAEATKK